MLLHEICKPKFYIKIFLFLKLFIVNLKKKNQINGQHEKNLVIKFNSMIAMIRIKYIANQNISTRQRPKSTKIINYPCSMLWICKLNIICAVKHLKNSAHILNQWSMSLPSRFSTLILMIQIFVSKNF